MGRMGRMQGCGFEEAHKNKQSFFSKTPLNGFERKICGE